jgi:hypothetical protein
MRKSPKNHSTKHTAASRRTVSPWPIGFASQSLGKPDDQLNRPEVMSEEYRTAAQTDKTTAECGTLLVFSACAVAPLFPCATQTGYSGSGMNEYVSV